MVLPDYIEQKPGLSHCQISRIIKILRCTGARYQWNGSVFKIDWLLILKQRIIKCDVLLCYIPLKFFDILLETFFMFVGQEKLFCDKRLCFQFIFEKVFGFIYNLKRLCYIYIYLKKVCFLYVFEKTLFTIYMYIFYIFKSEKIYFLLIFVRIEEAIRLGLTKSQCRVRLQKNVLKKKCTDCKGSLMSVLYMYICCLLYTVVILKVFCFSQYIISLR